MCNEIENIHSIYFRMAMKKEFMLKYTGRRFIVIFV